MLRRQQAEAIVSAREQIMKSAALSLKMEHKRNACAWRTNDIDIKKSNLRTTECRQGLEK
jgi:hypothetical protein